MLKTVCYRTMDRHLIGEDMENIIIVIELSFSVF